jgi:hypothetical protein
MLIETTKTLQDKKYRLLSRLFLFYLHILILQRSLMIISPYMHIMNFDQIRSLYYSFIPPLHFLNLSFKSYFQSLEFPHDTLCTKIL